MKSPFWHLLRSSPTVLEPGQRTTHVHVIGQPGTGKSRALQSWIQQDIAQGKGVGVIDPHGDLFRSLLLHLSQVPDTWRRVVVLDPTDPKWTVSFNPLEAVANLRPERLALFLTDVVVKIWKLDAASSPRMVWLLTNTFLALSQLGLTLLDLPRFLLDTSFRESLIPRLDHEGARSYFEFEFPKSPGAIHQWVTPVLNKIGGLIFDPDIRPMLAGRSTIDFRSILDRRRILLVNLPKGIIGEAPSALLGAFIVASLQKAALSRANSQFRTPFYLYLDEFQNYTTDNIKDVLSESRKYALSLTLAHQYLDQLSPDLRSAVLSTTGTLTSFRVSYADASRLAKEIFPSPDYLIASSWKLSLRRFGMAPMLALRRHRQLSGWHRLAHALASLPPRVFWSIRRGPYLPVKQRTFDVPEITAKGETMLRLEELRATSGSLYGKLKNEAKEGLRAQRRHANLDETWPNASPELDGDATPFWGY